MQCLLYLSLLQKGILYFKIHQPKIKANFNINDKPFEKTTAKGISWSRYFTILMHHNRFNQFILFSQRFTTSTHDCKRVEKWRWIEKLFYFYFLTKTKHLISVITP